MSQDIGKDQLYEILADIKLVKSDFNEEEHDRYQARDAEEHLYLSNYQVTETKRWSRFYSNFVTIENDSDNDQQHAQWKTKYSLLPIQIGLFYLAQGSPLTKAKAICDLFSEG